MSYFDMLYRESLEKSTKDYVDIQIEEKRQCDPFPDETIWLNSIENTNSPLLYLEYGIMSMFIVDKVTKLRSKYRHETVEKLIKNIHNQQLDKVWKNILEDARMLPNYKKKNWLIGSKNKKGRLKFFENNDISIKYLTEQYDIQKGGPPEFEKGDLVLYKGIPCIISEKITKKYYNALRCKRYWELADKTKPYNQNTNRYKYHYQWHRYERVNCNGGGKIVSMKIDAWDCVKVGVETKELIEKRTKAIENYNNDLEKRKKLWNDVIEKVILPKYENNANVNVRLLHRGFYDMNTNIWKYKNPPPCWHIFRHNLDQVSQWNQNWQIIISSYE